MRRHLKPVLVHSLFVLYAGTMLLGRGLHQLSGCHHRHTGLGHHAADGHAETKFPAVQAGEDDDADSCPICQFHAQAQCASPLAESPRLSLDCYDQAAETYVCLPPQVAASYSSRAPPLG